MQISCKYEEIYAPQSKDFIYITDKGILIRLAYSKEELVKMEGKIFFELDFLLNFPCPLVFFDVYNLNLKLENK